MAELNLEAINQIRTLNGQEPLTELPTKEVKLTPEEEAAAKAALVDPKDKEPKPKEKEKVEVVTPELNNDAVLEYLRKQGITATTLEDLKPKEDPTAAAERRDAEKLSWALSKGKLTKKENEAFIIDSNNPQDFIFRNYYTQAKEGDPELTDEEINTEFAARFGLDSEPGTRRHKRGQQELAILADQMLRMKHSKVFAIDNEFGAYENNSRQQQEFNKKVLAGAPIYKNDVQEVMSGLKKISAEFGEGEVYEVDAIEDSLNQIQAELMDNEFLARQVTNGYTKDTIKEIAFTRYLRLNFPLITQEIAKQHLLKHQAGTRGIVKTTITTTRKGDAPILTPEQEKMVEIMNANKATAPVN